MSEELKFCLYCEKGFIAKHKRQIFCCASCAAKYHNKKRQPNKPPKKCIICGKEFIPWNKNQVTCGCKECVKAYSLIQKKKKRGAYKYAKNGGLTMPPPPPSRKKKKKPWADCTPEERWEQMTLTELTKEIARLFKGKSFGQVRILKEQGKLPDDFGKGGRNG